MSGSLSVFIRVHSWLKSLRLRAFALRFFPLDNDRTAHARPETTVRQQPGLGRRITRQDPEFFPKLSRQQSPEYLWIGCSDSRVPANEIVEPAARRAVRPPQHRQRRRAHGPELPVRDAVRRRCPQGEAHHRVRPLRLQRRARRAALRPDRARPTTGSGTSRTSREKHAACVHAAAGGARARRPPVRAERHRAGRPTSARRRSCATPGTAARPSTVHGWIYGLKDGLLKDLNFTVPNFAEAPKMYSEALKALG